MLNDEKKTPCYLTSEIITFYDSYTPEKNIIAKITISQADCSNAISENNLNGY